MRISIETNQVGDNYSLDDVKVVLSLVENGCLFEKGFDPLYPSITHLLYNMEMDIATMIEMKRSSFILNPKN